MIDRDPAPPHTHCWIDPTDPPIARAPYSPVIGDQPHEMKSGRQYVCRECGAVVLALAPERA